jgi:hypothetical protein
LGKDTDTFQIEFDLAGIHYCGDVCALLYCDKFHGLPGRFIIELNRNIHFYLEPYIEGWVVDRGDHWTQEIADAVGDYLQLYYE